MEKAQSSDFGFPLQLHGTSVFLYEGKHQFIEMNFSSQSPFEIGDSHIWCLYVQGQQMFGRINFSACLPVLFLSVLNELNMTLKMPVFDTEFRDVQTDGIIVFLFTAPQAGQLSFRRQQAEYRFQQETCPSVVFG